MLYCCLVRGYSFQIQLQIKKNTINLQNIVIQYLFAVTSSLLSIVYGSNMLSENATYIVMSPIFNYIFIFYVSYAVSMNEEDI